jgi:predicted RNase H-like HicB family nuclease
MGRETYIALVHKDADSDFGVSFPDFPGLVTAGRTLHEAVELAEEALALHVAGMVEDGEAIPAPSSLEEVRATERGSEHPAEAVTLVPVWTERRKAIRVDVTMPADVVDRIERHLRAHPDVSRSGFLTRAAVSALEKE